MRYYHTDITVQDVVFHEDNFKRAAPLFERLHFSSLLKEVKPRETLESRTMESNHHEHVTFAQKYGYTFIVVTTQEALEKLFWEIKHAGYCALDTETNSLIPLQSTLVGISLCCHSGTSYYIPVGHETSEEQLSKDSVFYVLKPLLEDPSIEKYLHHAKFDQLVLYNAGIDLKGVVFDTLIAADLVKKR